MQKSNLSVGERLEPNVDRFSTTLGAFVQSRDMAARVIRYAPGKGLDQIMGFSTRQVGLAHLRYPHEACVQSEQPKGRVPFTLPLVPAQAWSVNGVAGHRRTLFINYGLSEGHLYAPCRNSVMGSVDTGLFLRTLGALGDYEPDENDIPRGALSLDQRAYHIVTQAFLDALYDWQPFETGHDLDHLVATALARAVLTMVPPRRHRTGRAKRDFEVFKRAHEHLLDRSDGAARIEDLCREAGVSSPTLSKAFRSVCGRTPKQYSTQFRLSLAHEHLLSGDSAIASVKCAALRAGFTEMGRFSALYRETYGVLPSKVLEQGRWAHEAGDIAGCEIQPVR